jgi:hypothetical protein
MKEPLQKVPNPQQIHLRSMRRQVHQWILFQVDQVEVVMYPLLLERLKSLHKLMKTWYKPGRRSNANDKFRIFEALRNIVSIERHPILKLHEEMKRESSSNREKILQKNR